MQPEAAGEGQNESDKRAHLDSNSERLTNSIFQVNAAHSIERNSELDSRWNASQGNLLEELVHLAALRRARAVRSNFPMKTVLLTTIAVALVGSLAATEHGKLIFEDHFERNESQETKEELSHGWGSNSKSRAKGNKQVDLKDGAMYIKTHAEADHAASVTHPAEFTNGAVELRFMLENEADMLGLDFADLQFKEVHAGHLFKVDVGTKKVVIDDMKSGSMNMQFYDAKKAKTLTKEQTQVINSMKKTFPAKLNAETWYTLLVTIKGETLTVAIDGKEAGVATSPGFAHPTKRLLRFSVPKSAVVDDLKIWAAP